jgi:ABC-type transporter Mla MlaB component
MWSFSEKTEQNGISKCTKRGTIMDELTVTAQEPGAVALSGSLTVGNAAEILKIIRGAIAQADSLVVTVGEDAEVDVSFLQILCSAHRTAAAQGKCFRLNTERTRVFEDASRAAGYIRMKGCSRDRDGSCLWAKGEK